MDRLLSASSPSDSPRKRVIVLGAGLAGLAAAWELKEAGHDVVVIEAQMRPGGRVLTLRDGFTPGLSVEAGAMSFSDSYRYLMHYVKLFQVPYKSMIIEAIRTTSRMSQYHLRGQLLRAQADGIVDWPFDLTAEERALAQTDIINKYILPLLDDIGDPTESYTLPDTIRPYDQKTLLELVAERGASPGLQQLIRHTFWFSDYRNEESAAVCLLSDIFLYYRGQTPYGFPEGHDSLPLAFASRLQEQIRYGCEAVRIKQNDEHVEIVIKAGDRLDRLSGDRVVCAIPFSVLRHIEIDPPFSPSKREVVDGLEYRPATRVFLQMRKRFWENNGLRGGAMTDLPVGQVQEHPIFHTGAEGQRGLLEAHGRGDNAQRLDAMTEDERLRFVIAEMEKVHPGVSEYYEGGQSKSWQDDPWSRGSISYFRAGQFTDWLPRIAQAEGRIHFAGEHTSIFPATTEGAIESGVRAAREVDEA